MRFSSFAFDHLGTKSAAMLVRASRHGGGFMEGMHGLQKLEICSHVHAMGTEAASAAFSIVI